MRQPSSCQDTCPTRHHAQVGPGIRFLAEGDVVLLTRPFAGTWRTLAIAKEKDLLRVGSLAGGAELAGGGGGSGRAAPAGGGGGDGRGGALAGSDAEDAPPRGVVAPRDQQQAEGGASAGDGILRPMSKPQAAAPARAAAGGGGGAGAAAADQLPLPLEYLAVSRELMTAYRLLEQHAELKASSRGWWWRGAAAWGGQHR